MNGSDQPVRATIMSGGLGGLAFLLAGPFFAPSGLWPWICFGIVWCLLAGYALLLVRWSGRGFPVAAFPLLLLGVMGVLMSASGPTFGLALAIFSWIRSGICYPTSGFRALFREVLLCGTGGLTLAFWGASTPLSWALGIWLFSLVQSLYFVLFEPGSRWAENPPADAFEQARQRIEALLGR